MKRIVFHILAPSGIWAVVKRIERLGLSTGLFVSVGALEKFSFSLLFLAAALSFQPSALLAQGGGQPGQFMSYGAGARGLGMGGAFFAVADDASASYWNPAGLTLLERSEFTAMQATMFSDTTLSFFTYAHPTSTRGTWAVSMTQIKSLGFEKISITANPGGDEIIDIKSLGSFDNMERAMAFSWGRDVSDKLSFGIMAKNITRSLDTSKDSFNAIDIAMMQKFSPTYRMAIGVQNVFSMASGDTEDKLPLTLKLGQALSLFKGSLLFGLDFIKPQSSAMNWRFGGEYWLMYWAALRFGVMGAPGIQEADFGVGIKYKSLGFDISQGIHALGTTTRFSVTMRMGQSNKTKHDSDVRTIVRQAMQYFKAGYFTRAIEKLKNAIDSDPGNMEIKRMLIRLSAAVDYVPDATGVEEVPTLARRGIIAYVDGKDLHNAVNILRHAFNKDSKNDHLLSLLNMVEKEAGVTELSRKPEGPEIFTYIDQRTYDARQAIYDGKYDLSMKRAQDILELEPNNETALEIMGSSFYLMNQKDKAKVMWEKVLDINPDNKIVKEFLQQIK
ncbi:MAG: PorV/PorQ family protein [Elusimicrobia bacterium]|nr:PorV/PorQ family protein [Elusimicrobiota bacterium]